MFEANVSTIIKGVRDGTFLIYVLFLYKNECVLVECPVYYIESVPTKVSRRKLKKKYFSVFVSNLQRLHFYKWVFPKMGFTKCVQTFIW